MYKALQDGWLPPRNVEEDEYVALRKEYCGTGKQADPRVTFISFACGIFGKEWGTFARKRDPISGKPENFAKLQRNWYKKCFPSSVPVEFRHGGYDSVQVNEPSVVYCDPPYRDHDLLSGLLQECIPIQAEAGKYL